MRREKTIGCGWTVALVALGQMGGWTPARGEFKTPTAITNVRIVTAPDSIIDSGTIVIVDGRIAEVGSEVEIPAHAQRIDGSGLTAYAGFIDAQSKVAMPDSPRPPEQRERAEDLNPDTRQGPLPDTRLANRRGIRPEFRAVEMYAPDDKKLRPYRAAGFTTAMIVPPDGILSGTGDLMNLGDLPIRRSVVASDLALHASFDSGEEGDYPRTLLGVLAQFRQVMLDAQWHARMQKYADRHPITSPRLATDAALEALQPLLAGHKMLFFEANTEREIRRALDLAAEFHVKVGITGGKEAWKVIDRIKAERIPLIVTLNYDEEPEYGKKKDKSATGRRSGKSAEPAATSPTPPEQSDEPDREVQEGQQAEEQETPEKEEAEPQKEDKPKEEKKIYEPLKVRKERRRLWEEQVANLIRLHEAGIPVALRMRDLKTPNEFWTNLRKVAERGLPEDAIVAALTAVPARLCGVAEQLGEIRRGRVANLVLTSGPLTEEKSKVKFVFIDGEKFEIKEDEKPDRPGRASGQARPGAVRAVPEPRGTLAAVPEAPVGNPVPHTNGQPTEPREGESDEKDRGPSFAAEIEADRVPATQTGGSVFIRGATIIPVTSPTLEKASILIRDGKIEALGQIASPPEGVTVIDATDRFVLPGFVDAHSHLGIDGVNESALAISAEVRIGDLINPEHTGIFRAAAGGTTTHHVMHGSANPIGGQNAVVKTKYGRSASDMLVANAPPTIKFALGENVTRANFFQARGRRFPGTRMGVEAVIRAAMHAGQNYRRQWDEYERLLREGIDAPPPRRDLRLEALADVVAGKLTVHAHSYRSDEILRLLRVAEDFGFRIGTLQHVLEGYRIAPEIARHGSGASTFSNFWAYKIEAFGAIPHNAALMTEHGVNVSINSDSPNTIRYFGVEAAKCIKWGAVGENEALRLVTINPAMQLQLDHRLGSLEVGKDGDVAIFNGHPLNTFSRCVMTLIEGEVYFEDARPEPTEPAAGLNLPGPVDRTIPATPHRAYAIVGATVHPISAPPIENGTVVIIEDRIHEVGPDVPVPPGAGVIDGRGLHVYPGLIDAGGSLGLTEIGRLRQTTDVADIADFSPHLRAVSAVHPHSEHIRIARTAGITAAVTHPSGGIISGQSAAIRLDGWTADEMLLHDEVALHMRVPSRPVRFPPRVPQEARERMQKQHKENTRKLEDFFEKAKHYAEVKAVAENDPQIKFEVDLTLEAMVPYVRGEKPIFFSVRNYKDILDTIEFAEKHKLRGALSGAQEAWKVADLLAEKDIPVIFSGPLSYPAGENEPWDSVYRAAAELDRAGVRFCFASSSAAGAYNLPIMAGVAVAYGLPRERAEYALTLGAARMLGIDDRVGSIEPGKQADLIVTTDTPLQTVSQVTHMFIAGRPVELTSLHTESYEKFKNRPQPDLPPAATLRGPPSLTRSKSTP